MNIYYNENTFYWQWKKMGTTEGSMQFGVNEKSVFIAFGRKIFAFAIAIEDLLWTAHNIHEISSMRENREFLRISREITTYTQKSALESDLDFETSNDSKIIEDSRIIVKVGNKNLFIILADKDVFGIEISLLELFNLLLETKVINGK